MTFKSLFGQFTIFSLNLVNFRVPRFHVSHLTHETFKLFLQNTLNMSKTTRVYFGALQVLYLLVGNFFEPPSDRAISSIFPWKSWSLGKHHSLVPLTH